MLHSDILPLCCDLADFKKMALLRDSELTKHMKELENLVRCSELCKFIFMGRLRVLRNVRLQELIDAKLAELMTKDKINKETVQETKTALLLEAEAFWVDPVIKRSAKVVYRGVGLPVKAPLYDNG